MRGESASESLDDILSLSDFLEFYILHFTFLILPETISCPFLISI